MEESSADGSDRTLDDAARLQDLSLRLVRRLRRRSGTSLTLSQASALTTLDRLGPMRVGELARKELISSSSATRLVAKLEHMRYLDRKVDPEDARSFVVTLTRRGRDLVASARGHGNQFLAAELTRLSSDDRAALVGALSALERLLALPQHQDRASDDASDPAREAAARRTAR